MASPKEKVPAVPPDPLALLADELGEIDRALAPHRTRIARETALKTQLRTLCEEADPPADAEVRVRGAKFDVILGPKASQTSIDFPRLVKIVKASAFAKFATCTLAALRDNAPGGVYEIVTTSAPTGPRSLKIFERAA